MQTTELAPRPTTEAGIARIVHRALDGDRLTREDGYALIAARAVEMPRILAAASELRDRGHGKTITFSAKIFVPLTNLCRDYCGYCTFRRDPGEAGARTMDPAEVLALARGGARLGVKEALFSLGDRPEAVFPDYRAWLLARGHRTTLEYLHAVCEEVIEATPLLPHANPGLMGERDLRALRRVTASMGIMLEGVADLSRPGEAHDRAPDKVPSRRLRTLQIAGELRIPFTTGILIGIGETAEERIDALLAIRELHDRHGHIQEIIVQSFRKKALIPMRGRSDTSLDDLERTVATARLLFGPDFNIEAPPNLSPDTYPRLIEAGLNDWGGISPLTIDHINPEAPWPLLVALRDATARMGYELRERLTIYPEYIAERDGFMDDRVQRKIAALVDDEGRVRPELEQWRRW
jgi:7,8-didemethyl-8-hydroxy-5-deazariboflavin synthase CofG subunit